MALTKVTTGGIKDGTITNEDISTTTSISQDKLAAKPGASSIASGLMTSADKIKLDGVADNANNYSHPSAHTIAEVTGLQGAIDSKVDDTQVLTDVPVNALFTDTVYTHPASHSVSEITGLQGLLDGKTTETYVNTQITNVVGVAPAALDTLTELAAALGDDANFAGTVTNALAGKVDDSQVLTNVPAGALFTDTNTVYSHPATHPASMLTGALPAIDGSALTGINLNNITGNLTVTGGIKLGDDTRTASVAGTGSLRWNTDTLQASDGTDWANIYTPPVALKVEVKMWGAGGGSGSQNRSGTGYHTTSYYKVKEGGAGGYLEAEFAIIEGTSLTFSIGDAGRGALLNGYPSSAPGGSNGGGNGTYSSSDASGGGGGYVGIFLSSGKTQATAIAISPGGGGGGGGPGYPNNADDEANGGGGINDAATGSGNQGARNFGFFVDYAKGGRNNAGGAGGDASVTDGDGQVGSILQGGNGVYYGNMWGSGGGGGGGWYGGGSGANDGNNWSGGGGGAGSAFIRGSGVSYLSDGSSSIPDITYVSHTFHTESFGSDDATYNNMRIPQGIADAQYPGGNIGYGGIFNTSPPNGSDGVKGAIVYRINNGAWVTLTTLGDTTITIG